MCFGTIVRLSLSSLLLIVGAIAVAMTWVSVPKHQSWPWNIGYLPYSTPEIPDEFKDKSRPAVEWALGNLSPTIRFENGAEIYRHGHLNGYRTVVHLFLNDPEWRRYNLLRDENLISQHDQWQLEHLRFAENDGCMKAMADINSLIQKSNESDCRSKLNSPSPELQRFVTPMTCTFMFVAILCVRYRIRTWHITTE